MKILVIGSGAREHAIMHSLAADPDVDSVVAAPGNPGMAELGTTVPVTPTDAADVLRVAREHEVDLVVIGPEAPLVAGVADVLRDNGFDVFGPSAAAARLEGSKAFAKDVMAAAEVPTAMCWVCTDETEARDALDATGAPYVVKDDGLAAGKGVVVTDDFDEALAHANSCFAAGGQVVIEEFLSGPEVSLFCITDGDVVVPLEPAQDFKRIGDNDEGPNTGGMGAYSPLDWAPEGLVNQVVERVAQPTIDEMKRRGAPFSGVLYVGLALTPRGPRVIEFNARFGDPETQVVLARLRSPLGALLSAAARGALDQHENLQWHHDSAVTVVLAAEGYPAQPVTGDVITGLPVSGDAYALHAGTARRDDELLSAGGRVLSVVGTGADLTEARAAAYAGVESISMRGSQFRSDIAAKAERGEVTA